MENTMNRLLFVYGTLVTSHAHPQGNRLRTEGLLLGPATIAGRLYRISWYPGLRPPEHAADIVHGEVYELNDPARALAWLDEYEGVTQGGSSAAPAADYTRELREVTMSDGTPRLAQVYLYQRPQTTDVHIPDGRWRG
jgi:gamma-glutamylcyclotransferase (GGCT)/AIG2-like uncharacterized protein YtfP